MNFKKVVGISLTILAITTFAIPKLDTKDNKLAKESAAVCKATASTKATSEMIIAKVEAAAKLVEKLGSKSYSKFKGKKSEFLFAGTYIWINDLAGTMIMHPIKPALNGKNLIGLKDGSGKRFFVQMIEDARTKGKGWTSYTWPKPGEKTRSLKTSYVVKAKLDGEDVIVGAGTYDLTEDESNQLTK